MRNVRMRTPRPRPRRSAISPGTGTPSERAVADLVEASGSANAPTWLPPAQVASMPRITYSVPSVTTRLGTRTIVTIAPLTTPQTTPIAEPGEQHERRAGHAGGGRTARRPVRREAEHRADREVDVARDDHDRLADREQRDDRRAREQLLQARRADEAWLSIAVTTITITSARTIPSSRKRKSELGDACDGRERRAPRRRSVRRRRRDASRAPPRAETGRRRA